jgi:hypothetical protein
MDSDPLQCQILADTKTGVVTIELNTDYGPILFSYSPAAVEAGITALAADILRRANEGQRAAQAVEGLHVPAAVVTNAAALYQQRANRVFPLDPIEEFSSGAEAYSRGTVEQFADDLIPAIIVMLDSLGATSLVVGGTDSDQQWKEDVTQDHKSSVELLQDLLSVRIARLATRRRIETIDLNSQ